MSILRKEIAEIAEQIVECANNYEVDESYSGSVIKSDLEGVSRQLMTLFRCAADVMLARAPDGKYYQMTLRPAKAGECAVWDLIPLN